MVETDYESISKDAVAAFLRELDFARRKADEHRSTRDRLLILGAKYEGMRRFELEHSAALLQIRAENSERRAQEIMVGLADARQNVASRMRANDGAAAKRSADEMFEQTRRQARVELVRRAERVQDESLALDRVADEWRQRMDRVPKGSSAERTEVAVRLAEAQKAADGKALELAQLVEQIGR